MSSQRPFDIIRWESPKPPTLDFIQRWMERDGLHPEQQEIAAGTHTAEVKFTQVMVRTVSAGEVQCSFPGYGVVELHPGDSVEIQPDTLHDIKVISREPAVLLSSLREK